MMNTENINQLYLKDTTFANLMQKRIFNVLLIASRYDAFMLEEDGRVDEQIFFEYVSLNLSSPPRVIQVNDFDAAFYELSSKRYDLVITMPGMEKSDAFEKCKEIKTLYPDIPIVVLTPFSREVSQRISNEDLSGIDYVFSWLGNADLLLAIIKLIEDKMNAQEDINQVGVQMILLVEDSIRFYSSILPHLYKFVLNQSKIFSTEALNEHEQMLRMRGRPKIKLARTYEEAIEIYNRYSNNVLGIISDVSFKREGVKDPQAGIRFCSYIRERDEFLPLIIESSEPENQKLALKLNACFLDKNSKKLPVDLGSTILRNFGFGDFEFINPQTGEVLYTVRNLKDLQNTIMSVPDESLYYHGSRNHISRWLYSRAMFPIAELLRRKQFTDISESQAMRQLIFDAIVQYRKMKNRGVVAIFKRDRFDKYSNFARIGQGSLGGKGRGLAFIDSLIKRHPILENYNGVSVTVPKTVVLCTDIFDEFMQSNNLYHVALSDIPDEQILQYFLRARLPDYLIDDFLTFFDVVKRPIAIRSSSLLEDSHYQPFAGIYSTYMIPYLEDKYEMLRMLSDAIKGVYASVFYADSKAYMTATSNVIDQEKMAIILQEVVGTQYDDRFYPSFSGVGRSLNYYPINDEKPEEGVVDLAVGLGKYIVDGGRSLRFSPKHPRNILQTSTLDLALSDTQTRFYALDLKNMQENFSVDDSFNLLKLHIREAEKDNSLRLMVSTFDPYDQIIRDGYYEGGRKVVTFANILQHDAFPLADLLSMMLEFGSTEMGRHVEIEFAGTLPNEENKRGMLYWLQIRPIVDTEEMRDDEVTDVPDEESLLKSNSALGHGIMDDLYHVVYVKTKNFRASNNMLIAREIEKINRKFTDRGENYILIGPGRWGSSDTALGIPVKWPHISSARLIVESALSNYRIEPSQGTHFFQNLTSFGVGYFTVNSFMNDGFYDENFLDRCEAIEETEFLRVVRFDRPVIVKINGKKNIGIVMKPVIGETK
ncbi:PEP/pyruvate-binding domain-containing protein [Coprobacter tertius]|uniref:Phosphoenolpyruvate synthase n=1 Tax=Coprobacter tertius TaxID=2944915 RepID=A0ABT1MFQ4_9BACT|nr:phosphoenolpyruvate synthase [Coprobacter tertius]